MKCSVVDELLSLTPWKSNITTYRRSRVLRSRGKRQRGGLPTGEEFGQKGGGGW